MVTDGQRTVNQPVDEVVSIDQVIDLSTVEGDVKFSPGTAYLINYTLIDQSANFGEIVDADGNTVYRVTPSDEYPRASRYLVRVEDEELPWRFAD